MTLIEHLNWFDFLLLSIIVLSIVISFLRGFLREAISLVTWIMAVVVALKFSPTVSLHFSSLTDSHALQYLIAFITLFGVVFIIGFITNIIVKRLVDVTGLTIVDRGLGLVFGAARGFIAVAVILMFLSVTAMQDSPWLQTSQLTPQFKPIVKWLDGFMPEPLQGLSQWVLGNSQIKSKTVQLQKGS